MSCPHSGIIGTVDGTNKKKAGFVKQKDGLQ